METNISNFPGFLRTLLTMWFILCSATASSTILKTSHGDIEGSTLTLFNGKNVDAFLGIPYAAAPFGENRFAPPQPKVPWNGTLQTKRLPMTCPQASTEEMRRTVWWVSEHEENEDCLYLNVWRPTNTTEEKLAIMVYIHGGAFMTGSSNLPVYDGSILAAENDIMFVSINYRLGMFGFLFLDDGQVPGNAGLQDQIQAIGWIKDNAAAFGGDPERITLCGQSAGSASVNAHLANANLYHKFRYAIMQSLVITWSGITMNKVDALSTSLTLSKNVQCPVKDKNQTLTCLRGKSALELQNTTRGMITDKHFTYCPVRNGIEVPLDPFNVAETVPASKRKSVIQGNVPMEMAIVVHDFFPGKYLTDNLTVTIYEMGDLMKKTFGLRDERLQRVLLHEYNSYIGDFNASNWRSEALTAVSDFSLRCPQITFTKNWVSETNQAYYFYFDYRPSRSLKYTIPKWVGTIHGDEVPFLFGAPQDPQNGYTEKEKKMSKTIMSFWTNFAKTGDPNIGSPAVDGIYWPSVRQADSFPHLEFRNGIITEFVLAERECDFWNQVYSQLLSIQEDLLTVHNLQ